MKRARHTAGFILAKLFGPVRLSFLLALLLPLLGAHAAQPAAVLLPPEPEPISGKGYRLVRDWDFGVNIRDEIELRQQFYTRYIYANGTLDHLNDEWQRYRDNANHVSWTERSRWSPECPAR